MLTGMTENIRARGNADYERGKRKKGEPPDFLPVRYQSLPAGAACTEDAETRPIADRLHSIPRVARVRHVESHSSLSPRDTRVAFPKSVHPR